MPFPNLADAILKTVNSIFGESVTYAYLAGGSVVIKGVFDNAFIEINGVSTKRPILRIRLADLSADPVEGDTATINSVTYKVMESHPDGFGDSTLILQKT